MTKAEIASAVNEWFNIENYSVTGLNWLRHIRLSEQALKIDISRYRRGCARSS